MSLVERWKAWWRGRSVRRRGNPDALKADASPAPPVEARALPAPEAAPRGRKATSSPAKDLSLPNRAVRPVRLALQGGGSHGAFTWGVLDGLLQRDDLAIEAVSGASAGALNAAVLASGWARAGREGAREALQAFWRDVGATGGASLLPLQASAFGPPFDLASVPGYDWASRFMRTLSPYDYNPLNLNPLRDVLVRHVDVDALRNGPVRVFVTATAVRSGEARVFEGDALGVDALLASACLPFLFQAVEIDGEPYWDGGYSGNPSIHPLIDPGEECDIVVVRINPAHREGVPRRSTQIMDRINEITFNASLIGELRMIAQFNRLQRRLASHGARPSQCRLHMIADDVDLATLPASSRMRVDPAFVARLHGYGAAAVAQFLDAHGDAIGERSSHSPAGDGAQGGEEALPGA